MTGDQLSIDDDALTELGRVIPSRTDDPDTSHAAAAEVRVKAGSQRAHLLEAFYFADRSVPYVDQLAKDLDIPPGLLPDGGLTDEQAMLKADGAVSPSSEYAKRCSELRDGGYIEPTGETRAGSAGPQRIVSRITEKGMAWIRENR